MTDEPPTPERRQAGQVRVTRDPDPTVKRRPGKPPKVLVGWNPQTGEWADGSPAHRAQQAIRVGNRMEAAAEWASIAPATLYQWLQRGRELDLDPEVDRMDFDDDDRPYVDFFRACSKSEAHAEVELVTLWRSAAKNDWKAAERLLARRYPKHWREQKGLEITGPDGGPITVATVSDPELAKKIASDPEARRLADALLARIAPIAPPNAPPPDDPDEAHDAELAAELEAEGLTVENDDTLVAAQDLADDDSPQLVDRDIDDDLDTEDDWTDLG